MSENTIQILGILITDRIKEANEVQQILTQYGCSIRTRIGIHENIPELENGGGLILCELFGDQTEVENLKTKLNQLDGIQVQTMDF